MIKDNIQKFFNFLKSIVIGEEIVGSVESNFVNADKLEIINLKPGIIPDLILEINSGEKNPNNYHSINLEVLYSNSDRAAETPGISIDDKRFHPFIHAREIFTDHKCSFNISGPNGVDSKLIINTPYFNNCNAEASLFDLEEYACYDIKNNSTLFLTSVSKDIDGDFFHLAEDNETILSFDSEGNNPFDMKVNHLLENNQYIIDVIFSNNAEHNESNNGYDVQNITIIPCENNGIPYVKLNGKWGAETSCENIQIDLADNPTANHPWTIHGFTKYTPHSHVENSQPISLDIKDKQGCNIEFSHIPKHNISINDSIISPSDSSLPMTHSNITVLPCNGKTPFLWENGVPHNQTICPVDNSISISLNKNHDHDKLWSVENNSEHLNYVAYLYFNDYFVTTECSDNICDSVTKIADSTEIPGWLRFDYGTDKHGVYYNDNSGNLSAEYLNTMSSFDDGVVITDIQKLKSDGILYTLIKLESQDRPIIFHQNTYQNSLPEYTLIDSYAVDLTPLDQNDNPVNALYFMSRNLNNTEHIIETSIEREFIFTNRNAEIDFSAINLNL